MVSQQWLEMMMMAEGAGTEIWPTVEEANDTVCIPLQTELLAA